MTDRRTLTRVLGYVDGWLAYRQPRSDIPGIAVAVSLAGKVLLDRAYGVADASSGEALTPEHRFRIASHSKTFTATVILQLAEQGRLRLDDAAADHLPWLRAHPDERFGRITLRQLLAHGAGVIRDGTDADYWQLRRPFPDAGALRAEILDAGLVLDPDQSLKYSNYGYSILGLVIEEVTGRPYGEVVEASVVRPLRLAATGAEWDEHLPGPWARGHGRRAGDGRRAVLPQVDTHAMAAATGFYGTAADLCRYFSAHLVGSGRLLGDASKREMQRTHWHVEHPGSGPHQDYGLGLVIEHVGERRTIGHSGGFPGHITRTMADPADGLVVSVLTNAIDGPASQIASGILRTIDRLATGEPSPARLRRVEGRYLNLYGALDVVAAGDRLLLGNPDSWDPFDGAEALEVAGPSARSGFRIAKTSSFGSPGEPATFVVEGGEAVSARIGGETFWAERRWPDAEARLLAGA